MTDSVRTAGLRQMLTDRRRAAQNEIQSRIRDLRANRAKDVRDHLEHSDAEVHGDMESTLLQMSVGTLTRIDQALVRLDKGRYGSCAECAGQITARRLRALPFAVRCRECEDDREQQQGRARRLVGNPESYSGSPDAIGS